MKSVSSKLLFIAITAAVCLAAWLALRPGRAIRDAGLGESFRFDDGQAARLPDGLPRYSEGTPIQYTASNVHNFCVMSDDRIVLAAAEGLSIMGPDGTPQRSIPLPFAPSCVTADTNDLLYVGAEGKVVAIETNGSLVSTIVLPRTNALPSSIAVRDQHLLVADAENDELVQLDRSGRFVRAHEDFVLFASPGFDVVFDSEGFIWANNPGKRELRKIANDGRLVASWVRIGRDITGFSGCCNPTDIAIMRDDSIVTSEKNILRVKVMNPSGEVTACVAGPEDFDPDTLHVDVAVDSRDRVLVLDRTRRQIRIFEKGQR